MADADGGGDGPDFTGDETRADADETPDDTDGSTTDAVDGDHGRRQMELAALRAENERLRSAYAAATRTRHRRTALGFAALGAVAVAGGLLLADAREVLLALGGTGLFAALLVVYLSPEQFLAASVGRDVYGALADNGRDIAAELGLTDERVYVPLAEGGRVRLFVPQHADYQLPPDDALKNRLVVTDDEASRGLSLRPTGAPLVEEIERATGDLGDAPEPLATTLAEALVEQFEILEAASVDAEPGRVTVAANEGAFGAPERFDHPVGSALAVGLARGLDAPVSTSVRASSDDTKTDWQVTCRWAADSTQGARPERAPEEGGN